MRWLGGPDHRRRRLVPVVVAVAAAVLAAGCQRSDAQSRWAAGASPTPTGSVQPSATASAAAPTVDQCVAAAVAKLSPEELAGQLVMIGSQANAPQGLADAVGRYHLGGTFLAGRASPSATSLHQAIKTLQDSAGAIPLHVAADQEGGQVQTLKGADFPLIPSAVKQGTLSDAALRDQTTDWARRLADAGVTMDLAPVADTVPAGSADGNPPIGAFDRQFGSAPDAVAQDIGTVVTAAQAAGILTTLKHFPGLGRVRANTDTSTQAVDTTTTADDPFLKPFVSGIAAGSAAVMISSARYPKLDPDNVAAFSAPVITGLLRQKLGYTGLVISDDLGVAAAVIAIPVGDRAVRFVRAGGDMVLSVKTADAAPMTQALVAAARTDASFRTRMTDAARHVVASKVRKGLVTCK
jgi:beta-N-acetylhexosaminidase